MIYKHYNDFTKLPATGLFAQELVYTDNKDIRALHYWHFVRGIHRWFLSQIVTNAENVSMAWHPREFRFQDMASYKYNGPSIIAAEMTELYPPEERDVAIIDVAAGSGLAGQCVSYFHSRSAFSISHITLYFKFSH